MGRDPEEWAGLLDRVQGYSGPVTAADDRDGAAKRAARKAGRAAKRAGARAEDAALAGAALDPDIATVLKRHEPLRIIGQGRGGELRCRPVEASGPDLTVFGYGWAGLVEVKSTGDASFAFEVSAPGSKGRRPTVHGKQRAMLDEAQRRGHVAAVLLKVRAAWWVLPWDAYKTLESRRITATARGYPRAQVADLDTWGERVTMVRGLPRWLPALVMEGEMDVPSAGRVEVAYSGAQAELLGKVRAALAAPWTPGEYYRAIPDVSKDHLDAAVYVSMAIEPRGWRIFHTDNGRPYFHRNGPKGKPGLAVEPTQDGWRALAPRLRRLDAQVPRAADCAGER